MHRLSLIALLMAVTLSGCGLVIGTAALGTAAVGAVGYTVYKGGAAVVSGAASVGSKAKNAVTRKHRSVVISRGTLKAELPHTVTFVYPAANRTLKEAGFTGIQGKRDSLKATLTARTSDNDHVFVGLELVDENTTAIQIRIGEGNLKHSEYLYDQINKILGPGEGEEE